MNTSGEQLLDPELVARGEALGVYARGLVEGILSGEHRSPYRGAAVEFSEHREYVVGDDLRRVDWKVLARSDRMYVKQYDQDTNFTAHVVLDCSRSMAYRSKDHLTKLEVAKRAAAALAYWVVRQGDSASAVVLGSSGGARVVPKTGSMAGLHSIMVALAQGGEEGVSRGQEGTPSRAGEGKGAVGPIGPALHEVAEKNARKGIVLVVSDFLEEMGSLLDAVAHLAFRGHEVVAFHVLDPAELAFPFEGDIELTGLEGEGNVVVQGEDVRGAYQEEIAAFCAQVRGACERMHGQYVLVNTGKALEGVLGDWLARRKASQRRGQG